MNREKRRRRIFALNSVSKLYSKTAATVHSEVDPKTMTEEERWLEHFKEREMAEVGALPTPKTKLEMEESMKSWKDRELEGEESLKELERSGYAPEAEDDSTPYREYVRQQLAAGQGGLISQQQIADRVNYWKTVDVVETGENEFDHLVVDPHKAGLHKLYLGAYKGGNWYPTRVSALLFWIALNGGKGIERDPAKVIEVPPNHPSAGEAPVKIYGLTNEQEELVLANVANLYDNLNKVLPTMEGRLNVPRLNMTDIKFNPDANLGQGQWELSGTRQQNLLVPAEGSPVRRGDPIRSIELTDDERALAKHLERDVVQYPQLRTALMQFDKELLSELIDEHIKQRFRSPEGKFEPALFGTVKTLRKNPEKMERVRDIIIESLLDKIRKQLKSVEF